MSQVGRRHIRTRLNETVKNDLFGRNFEAANLPPITIYDGFLQPRMREVFKIQLLCSVLRSGALCTRRELRLF